MQLITVNRRKPQHGWVTAQQCASRSWDSSPSALGRHGVQPENMHKAQVLVCIPPRALPGVTGQLTGAWGQNMGYSARQLERAGDKYQKGCCLCPVWPQTWYTTQNHLCPLRPQRVTPGSWFLKWFLRNTAREQRATLSGDVLSSQGCHKAPQPGRLETTDMYYLRSGS